MILKLLDANQDSSELGSLVQKGTSVNGVSHARGAIPGSYLPPFMIFFKKSILSGIVGNLQIINYQCEDV